MKSESSTRSRWKYRIQISTVREMKFFTFTAGFWALVFHKRKFCNWIDKHLTAQQVALRNAGDSQKTWNKWPQGFGKLSDTFSIPCSVYVINIHDASVNTTDYCPASVALFHPYPQQSCDNALHYSKTVIFHQNFEKNAWMQCLALSAHSCFKPCLLQCNALMV